MTYRPSDSPPRYYTACRPRSSFSTSILALTALFGSACAFSAVNRPKIPGQTAVEDDFEGGEDTVFAATKDVLGSMGFNVTFSDPTLRMATTNTTMVPIEDNCDCGTWNGRPVKGTADLSLSVITRGVEKGASAVAIDAIYKVKFTGRNTYGAVTRQEFYRCRSTGRKEEDFFRRLQEYLETQR